MLSIKNCFFFQRLTESKNYEDKLERIYEYLKFLHVLSVGFDNVLVESISNMDFVSMMNAINVQYANMA